MARFSRKLLDAHYDEWQQLKVLPRPPHTLRRAADALGFDLVYLLVPRRPLTAVVLARGGLWIETSGD